MKKKSIFAALFLISGFLIFPATAGYNLGGWFDFNLQKAFSIISNPIAPNAPSDFFIDNSKMPTLKALFSDPEGKSGFINFAIFAGTFAGNCPTSGDLTSGRSTEVQNNSIAEWQSSINLSPGDYFFCAAAENIDAAMSSWVFGLDFQIQNTAPNLPEKTSETNANPRAFGLKFSDIDGDNGVMHLRIATDAAVCLSGPDSDPAVAQTEDLSFPLGGATELLASFMTEKLPASDYFFCAQAEDDEAATSNWVELSRFSVTEEYSPPPTQNSDPNTPTFVGQKIDFETVSQFSAKFSDPDGDAGKVYFYISPNCQNAKKSGVISVQNNLTAVWNVETKFDFGTYFWSAKSVDASGAESSCQKLGSFSRKKPPEPDSKSKNDSKKTEEKSGSGTRAAVAAKIKKEKPKEITLKISAPRNSKLKAAASENSIPLQENLEIGQINKFGLWESFAFEVENDRAVLPNSDQISPENLQTRFFEPEEILITPPEIFKIAITPVKFEDSTEINQNLFLLSTDKTVRIKIAPGTEILTTTGEKFSDIFHEPQIGASAPVPQNSGISPRKSFSFGGSAQDLTTSRPFSVEVKIEPWLKNPHFFVFEKETNRYRLLRDADSGKFGGEVSPNGRQIKIQTTEIGTFVVADILSRKTFEVLKNENLPEDFGSEIFSDISPENPAHQWAAELWNRFIFSRDSAGKFNPEMKINRADFSTVILRAFLENQKYLYDWENLSAEEKRESLPFVDTEIFADYAPYVAEAKKKEIMKGYRDLTFRPKDTISRAEAITVAARVSGLPIERNLESNFSDIGRKFWFNDYVTFFEKLHFFDFPLGGVFHFESYLSEQNDPSSEILDLKLALKNLGLFAGNLDENFDADLTAAVKKFQTIENVRADGHLNLVTRTVLNSLQIPRSPRQTPSFFPNLEIERGELSKILTMALECAETAAGKKPLVLFDDKFQKRRWRYFHCLNLKKPESEENPEKESGNSVPALIE
jgi:hypothetical protein